MTIREAKQTDLLLSNISELAAIILPVEQQNAISFLRRQVDKKRKKYPKYFIDKK